MALVSRQLLAAAAVSFLAAPAFATQIGPDAYGYSAQDVAISWVDISGTGTATLTDDDDATTTQSIGFTFNFYGVDYTTVSWSPNGLLTFGGTNGQYSNVDLTTTATDGDLPSIAVLWDDIVTYDGNGADAVYFETLGAPGSRQLVVQWNNLNHIAVQTSNYLTFEVILFEGTNRILMQYLDLDVGDVSYDEGASATIGIRDTDGQNTGSLLQWSALDVGGGVGGISDAFLFPSDALQASGTALSFEALTTPEPGTYAMFGLGVAGLGAIVARRRRRAVR